MLDHTRVIAHKFVRGFVTIGIGMLFGCAITITAHADQLILKNGDRITGEIKRIWDKEITIEPEYADEFQVDLDAVEYIEAERDFEIQLADGREVVAQFRGHDNDNNQIIVVGDVIFSIALLELRELEEPADYFDWDSHIDFSAAINKGNTDSENSKLRADTSLKLGDHRHLGDISFIRDSQDGVSTKQQDLLKYNYNWLFSDPWFVGGIFTWERDPIRLLERRVVVGALAGRDIWDRPRRHLSFSFGLGYSSEEFDDNMELSTGDEIGTGQNAVALWGVRFRQDFIGDDLKVFHNHSLTANISGRTNAVIKTSTGLSYEITDLLFAKLSLDFDYETEPAAGAEKEDLALLVGIGLEFE